MLTSSPIKKQIQAWDGHFGLPPKGGIRSNDWVLVVTKASAFELDALDSRIKELVAYARERDGEDRSVLYRNLVDLFLTGKAPQNDPTRSQLLDVLQALIPHVEAEARSTTCDLVANISSPPIDLVMRLVQDRARIVASLLMRVQFDDDDLIELIEKTGREHHQVVASREDLSANIWIALARAAPNAPPFDHNSTLALWSEDLGITQTKMPRGKENESHEILNKAHSDNSTSANGNKKNRGATVTPLHRARKTSGAEKTGATIRILRTDEDLVAARATAHKSVAVEMEAATKHVATAYQEATQNVTENTVLRAEGDIDVIRQQAQDPGPGGWAWLSDRDGFVTSLSAYGKALLGDEYSANDASMLDLLGLNAKLGHPVARAFQRRSAIHDAPIFLPELEEKHRHWTLEATPYFSSPGGIFEGYEGVLTPVVAVANDTDLLPAEDDAPALFLDDIVTPNASAAQQDRAPREPTSFTEQASVFETGILGPETKVPPVIEYARAIGVLKPTQQALEEIAADMIEPATQFADPSVKPPIAKATATKVVPAKPAGDISQDNLASAASMVVKEVLAEALAPLEASIKEQLEGAGTKAASEEKTIRKTSEASQPTDELTSNEVGAHIAATFDLLEKALGHLMKAGVDAGDPQARLQGEIASACIRSLKDQVS